MIANSVFYIFSLIMQQICSHMSVSLLVASLSVTLTPAQLHQIIDRWSAFPSCNAVCCSKFQALTKQNTKVTKQMPCQLYCSLLFNVSSPYHTKYQSYRTNFIASFSFSTLGIAMQFAYVPPSICIQTDHWL